MDHLSIEMDQEPKAKKQHIEWRRYRVLELSSQGRTEREIATILKVGAATVGRDLSYLHKQARDNLRFHVQERLPDQYERCQNGLNQVLKIAWNTVLLESGPGPNRLQALSLIGDIYRYQMELSVNAGIIEQAIHFVSQKKEQLGNTLHNNNNNEESETKDKTTSTVF
jgi:orotate phosphoribosyltransferase-like protein